NASISLAPPSDESGIFCTQMVVGQTMLIGLEEGRYRTLVAGEIDLRWTRVGRSLSLWALRSGGILNVSNVRVRQHVEFGADLRDPSGTLFIALETQSILAQGLQ